MFERRRVLPVGQDCCHSLVRSHFHHRRLTGDRNHARRTRLQFVNNLFKPGAFVLNLCRCVEKNLVPEKQRLYQVRFNLWFWNYYLPCVVHKALSQADLLPPSSLRPLYGYTTYFFAAIGKTVTSLLGLYKAGFTLGVCGIAYSAFSLIKVGGSLYCSVLTRC